MNQLPRRVKPTRNQEEAMIEARISFMRFCPFFCHYFYEEMEEYVTHEVETLATDGRRIFVNPSYLESITPMERCFAYAHEVDHTVLRDPQRMKYYADQGYIQYADSTRLDWDQQLANQAMDYRINANLVDLNIGACNPAWLYDPKIKADEVFEDVYRKLHQKRPPQPQPQGTGNQPGGQPGTGNHPTTGSGSGDDQKPPTYGDTQRGGRPDKTAQANQGQFDEVLEPYEDPVTGKTDLPTEIEFTEAIARAAAAAKAIGKLPGSLQRMVDEILEPQVDWRDHIRMVLTGKIGRRRESWDTPNRRRIVLNPMVYLPGKRGHGANDVTVVIDNSGSISEAELTVFFSEVSAILADCKPKLVRVLWCDWEVRRVEEARCLDELEHIRVEGSPGGGGTDFRPPFDWLAERAIKPDTVVYLTDMMGSFPQDPKVYPVVWCATTDIKAPFGETVHVEVRR
jgi:predicted metal-dependent peptidase